MREHRTPVLIIGAGPVGLTLAIDLAARGVASTIVEMRAAGQLPSVKCNHVSARSMEFFRRLGLAERIRSVGLPADYPNDVSYTTTITGIEFARIPIPCRARRYTAKDGPDTWWPTPEPPHRVNQIYLEPTLFAHAASLPEITLVNRAEVIDIEQNDGTVVATVKDLEDGRIFEIAADYLVGCDGGRSLARKKIGAQLHGTAVIQRTQSTHIRAPGLIHLIKNPAWMTIAHNPRRQGAMVAIDGREEWLVHTFLPLDNEDFDAVDRDAAVRTILGVGPEFEYELIAKEDWIGRRLVASRFRDRRVFICGDAAHLWIPYAGYGMNAGIADATNLSWKLAAVVKGWGGEALLDSYEAERLPITDQVSNYAMNHALQMVSRRANVPSDMEDQTEAGDALRRQMGADMYELNVKQYCCAGLNFGYFYKESAILSDEAAEAPAYTMDDFTASTVPGCRTPHFWLEGGRSLYDALGPDYTLIRFDERVPVEGFVAAASALGVPLQILDVAPGDRAAPYECKLVLSRPDLHIAWRGDSAPDDVRALIGKIAGVPAPSEAAARRYA